MPLEPCTSEDCTSGQAEAVTGSLVSDRRPCLLVAKVRWLDWLQLVLPWWGCSRRGSQLGKFLVSNLAIGSA